MSNPFDNLKPKYNYTVSRQPTINVVSFGDGFEQRLTEGLNRNPRKLRLTFENITESESDTLINFLNRVTLTCSFREVFEP